MHGHDRHSARVHWRSRPVKSAAGAVRRFHSHAIPLDMEDIERDWGKPITDAGIAAKASVIVRVGMLDLGAGTGSFRVREMMHRIAYPLGVHVRADVNLTDIHTRHRRQGTHHRSRESADDRREHRADLAARAFRGLVQRQSRRGHHVPPSHRGLTPAHAAEHAGHARRLADLRGDGETAARTAQAGGTRAKTRGETGEPALTGRRAGCRTREEKVARRRIRRAFRPSRRTCREARARIRADHGGPGTSAST